MTWETTIGLEVHAQLKTNSKLFSGSNTTFGAPPNTQTSYLDAALPGTLPVINQHAVTMAIQFGLAIQAQIQDQSLFERKNYFYPDLPKGYQISQYQRPILENGHLDILLPNTTTKTITIQRAHLEEDAGKLLHESHPSHTAVDLNRAGTPLLEIVTTPCITSAQEAVIYLKTLHQLIRFLGICDGNMQEGSFRCDVNLSLKPCGSTTLGTRVELKNLNSFRYIEKAIHYEQQRQADLLDNGQSVRQETRLYCPNTNRTQTMRSKENENDYRYFPDPDLLPIRITKEDIIAIQQTLPPLPHQIRHTLHTDYLLSEEDIEFLLSSPAHYRFFMEVQQQTQAPAKTTANWLKGTYTAALHEAELTFENPPVAAHDVSYLLNHLVDKTLTHAAAKNVFAQRMRQEDTVEALIQKTKEQHNGLDNTALKTLIQATIEKFPEQVVEYRAGKEKLLSFFVGQIIKQTKVQASPEAIHALLRELL